MKSFILCFILIFTVCYAHPGKTDSGGGHYNKSTGEYHYHHGYPAHSVCGINCPYNNIDATNHNSSNSSGSNSSKSKNSKTTVSDYSSYQLPFWKRVLAAALVSIYVSPLTTLITGGFLSIFKSFYDKIANYIWIIGYIESFLFFYFAFY
jgi:hypothetical protein